MPKEFINWSGFMAGERGEPEDPRSRPVTPGPVLKKGEVPRRPSDWEIRKTILSGAPKQPTDQQLFGHLVPTEEQVKAAEEQWNGQFTRFFKTKHEPVEKNSPNDFGNRGPVNQNDPSQLTEEEQRIRQIPVDPSLLSGD